MSFLDKLNKTAGAAAGRIGEKSRRSAALTRVRTVLRVEEKAAEKEYLALGRYFYNNLRDSANEVTGAHVEQLDAINARIERTLQALEALYQEDGPTAVVFGENAEEVTLDDVEAFDTDPEDLKELDALDGDPAARAAAFAAQAAEKAKEKAGQLSEYAKEKAEKWGGIAKEKGEKLGELAKEKGGQLTELAKEKAEALKDKVDLAPHKVIFPPEEDAPAEAQTETVAEAVEDAGEFVAEVAEAVAETAEEAADQAEESVKAAAQAAAEAVKETVQQAAEDVKEAAEEIAPADPEENAGLPFEG